MKLTQSTAYAVHAMIQLARTAPGRPIPCRQLANAGRMPDRFLLQILRSLVGHGLLRSTRGVDGGYCLARAPQEISLLEIIDSLDNSPLPVPTALESIAPSARARLCEAMTSATKAARAQLQEVSLAELSRAERRAEPPLPLPAIVVPEWVFET